MASIQQWEQAAADGNPPPSDATDAASFPGMNGLDPTMMEGTFGSDTSRRGANNLLILLLVAAVGGGSLWAMRAGGSIGGNDSSLAVVETKIDMALQRLGNKNQIGSGAANLDALFKDTDQIVAMFAHDPTRKQVPVESLAKDPFELYAEDKPAVAAPGKAAAAEDKSKAEKLRIARDEFSRLKLQSLLSGGATSLAVINGRVVKEGEELGSFKVVSISSSGVRLICDGAAYTLSMDPAGSK